MQTKISLVLLSLSFFLSQIHAVEINCRWKNGSIAENYLPCNPSSTRGSCCLEGEACLESGLCYGSLGIIYRGACNNVWNSNMCLTYCEDKSENWANIYACPPRSGANGPVGWWCGRGKEVACSENGTMLKINPGLPVKILGLFSESNSSSSTTTTSSATQSSTPTASNSPLASAPPTANKTAFIGLGVGIGILVLVMAIGGFLWFRYHRKQKEQLASVNEHAVDEYRKELAARNTWVQGPPAEMDSDKRRAELEARHSKRGAVELDSTGYI